MMKHYKTLTALLMSICICLLMTSCSFAAGSKSCLFCEKRIVGSSYGSDVYDSPLCGTCARELWGSDMEEHRDLTVSEIEREMSDLSYYADTSWGTCRIYVDGELVVSLDDDGGNQEEVDYLYAHPEYWLSMGIDSNLNMRLYEEETSSGMLCCIENVDSGGVRFKDNNRDAWDTAGYESFWERHIYQDYTNGIFTMKIKDGMLAVEYQDADVVIMLKRGYL